MWMGATIPAVLILKSLIIMLLNKIVDTICNIIGLIFIIFAPVLVYLILLIVWLFKYPYADMSEESSNVLKAIGLYAICWSVLVVGGLFLFYGA